LRAGRKFGSFLHFAFGVTGIKSAFLERMENRMGYAGGGRYDWKWHFLVVILACGFAAIFYF